MLIDNKKNRFDEGLKIVTVWDFLNEFSGNKSEQTGDFDIVTGYFTIFTLSKLYEELPEETHVRIISSEMVGDDYKKDYIVNLLGDDLDISAIGNLDKCSKQAIAFLERDNVEMRAEIPDFCHAKAYLFKNNDPRKQSYYVTGSSNFTPAGIGLKTVPNVELNIAEVCNNNNNEFVELRKWYEDIWENARKEVPEDKSDKKSPKISAKEYFIRKIKEYFRTYTPEEIYYKILFELFNSEINLEGGIEHTRDMSLLQTSVIWRTLFNYQQKGVISLIKMLRKYNGAILADAVGLGKTFSALAVIKYFQIQNYTTILLCPKKLEQNWVQYLQGTGSRFEKDEFKYKVRFHSDLQNNRLQNAYSTFRLDYLQSRKKVLIVIDESHNLRNEKSTRYQELLKEVIQNQEGIEKRDVKVLMLSATPINTGLKDVKGQFNLIGHGNDNAFSTPDFDVESLSKTFLKAQKIYKEWCKDDNRTIGTFISKLPQRFFNLTDKLIVARTRKLIEKTLGENLGFPQKKAPTNIYKCLNHFGKYSSTTEIYQAFEYLSLTAYQPSIFLFESRKEARKEAKRDWDDNVNRETFLVKMMCILFLKRLESSWFSLKSTVENVLNAHEETLDKVLRYEKDGIDDVIRRGETIDEEEFEELGEHLEVIGQIKVSDLKNLGGFKWGLQKDTNKLREIYKGLQEFEEKYRSGEECDPKLDELVKILKEKQNADNKKVVIFTAYADTAEFLYNELKLRGFSHMAAVTGQKIYTTGAHSRHNFTEVLQSFAPYSKLYRELDWDNLYELHLNPDVYYNDNDRHWEVPYNVWFTLVKQYCPHHMRLIDDNIDILIATDCLSEGQNLQDADMQINYDIHWNPVRLIQRFGRIDRIGSPNKEISCVNFWPEESFERYLALEARVQNRMTIMSVVGVEGVEMSDEYKRMVEENPIQDKNADRLLEELTNNSISDIESPQTLTMQDFSFESYRQDLVDYYSRQQDFYRRMPNGIFSGFINQSSDFADMPDSLIALMGYPKKPEGAIEHNYSELYIMCQPIDAQPYWQEINKADVLEFLRKNKSANRLVPDWIIDNPDQRIAKLSDVLKLWMEQKAQSQAVVSIKNKLGRKKISSPATPKNQQLLEEKFKVENFDLIIWEYVTHNDAL